ncbi:MAG: hypothetical protein A3D16_11105 [Rhodobacterales bacterium RIFCSPHIGHO2_02_FULL_62_130]|jgi:hypothetical protein|nr:MAG: hypothetical protein A3D16_11105 [Rhodobacterales bacterium RIFCSPHIGHO2_02_FULL_62_130]OHC56528.1 MAG: hypothetical protein A3E48_22030 [Rhodobacterales bacterium RIFCSPHIGHO2_12_FULL_62_75]
MRAMMAAVFGLGLMGGIAAAQDVLTEVATLGGSTVTLHVHGFLSEQELATLRVIGTNEEALKLFVVSDKGHAAIAVSPEDGFIRDGAPVASAIAVADLPDAETAKADALAACDAARNGASPCVILLQVSPAS